MNKLPDPASQAERYVVRKTMRVDGRLVAYREEPEPRHDNSVVLVHGLGMSGASFDALLPLLVADLHVLAPDLPGCGGSERHHKRRIGIGELCDTIVAWADAAGLDRFDLVGHSLGAQIAARLAARHPGRVKRLVLVACPPDPSAPHAWQEALRLLRDAPNEPPAVLLQATGDYLRATPRMMWRTLKRALRSNVEEAARAITVPTLVVRGSRDPVVTQRWAEELTGLIPQARLVTIPLGTHGLPTQSADALGRVIRTFLLADGPT